jgi:chloride channel protein, CIC family
LLVLGSQLVLFFGLLCGLAFPQLNTQPEGFAFIGVAAVFTGVMRAPLAGIALVRSSLEVDDGLACASIG